MTVDKIVRNIEDGHKKPVLGVDVRLRYLAENYVQARRDQGRSRPSFRELLWYRREHFQSCQLRSAW